MVIFLAEWNMQHPHPDYPVGKSRLETIGVIVSAGIMSVRCAGSSDVKVGLGAWQWC